MYDLKYDGYNVPQTSNLHFTSPALLRKKKSERETEILHYRDVHRKPMEDAKRSYSEPDDVKKMHTQVVDTRLPAWMDWNYLVDLYTSSQWQLL